MAAGGIADGRGLAVIPEVVVTYVEAFSSSDLERCVATFAHDGIYSAPGTPGPLARQQIEEHFRGVFARYPGAAWETVALDALSDDTCVWRWILRATHTGSNGAPPAPERRLTLAGCEFITVRAGKIHRVEGYFDRLGVLEQLGASPSSQS